MRAAALVLAAALLASGAPLAGQTAAPRTSPSPRVPDDHWALDAARRGAELGWILGYAPERGAPPVCVLVAAFQEASDRAVGERERGMAEGWAARLAAEHPRMACDSGAPRVTRLAAGIVGRADRGAAAPGIGDHPPFRTGLITRDDRATGAATLAGAARVGPFSLALQPTLGTAAPEVIGDAELFFGPVAAAVGRQPVRYGAARGGSVVLSGGVPLQRIQVETPRPVELPGPGRWLGSLTVHTFLSRLDEERHQPHRPWFWGGSGTLRPHPRFSVSIHRAALFAPTTSPHRLTPGNLLRMTVGMLTDDFEDQVVSVEGRLRLPTEPLIPLTAYLEWGAEDAAGAWWAVPGQVLGLSVPALPGLPELSLGVEVARFGGSCCGNPKWYRHVGFPGSWAARGEPLAHPLGGEGGELLAYGRYESARLGAHVAARAFLRGRGDDNLFVPGREGGSQGGALELGWSGARTGELGLAAAVEAGSGWSETRLRAFTRISF
jgi:hypothetical protein